VGFELKDAFEVARTEIAGYAQWFTSAVASPTYIGQRAIEWRDDGPASAGRSKDFYVVLVVSAVLGATIGAIIPDRPPLKNRFTVAVVVVLAWLCISVRTHFSNFVALLVTSAAAVFPPLSLSWSTTGSKHPAVSLSWLNCSFCSSISL
jgi:hypothetical protein